MKYQINEILFQIDKLIVEMLVTIFILKNLFLPNFYRIASPTCHIIAIVFANLICLTYLTNTKRGIW